MEDILHKIPLIFAYGIPILLAITLHEAAHGFVAWRLGDDTAYMLGRVSFNPIKHIDPIGTVLIPGMLLAVGAPFLFGYAKPVPVNFRRLNNPRRDMVLVAVAGPLTNIFLAFVSAVLLKIVWELFAPDTYSVIQEPPGYTLMLILLSCQVSIFLNILLAIFNMLPLPPLDGGRVAVGLLPRSLAMALAKLEPYGFMILIGFMFVLPYLLRQVGIAFSPFVMLLLPIVDVITEFILALVGLS